MAQSQPFLGRLQPFYGWYKRVNWYPWATQTAKKIIFFHKRIVEKIVNYFSK